MSCRWHFCQTYTQIAVWAVLNAVKELLKFN
jgi:hypothetical protein